MQLNQNYLIKCIFMQAKIKCFKNEERGFYEKHEV